MMSATETEIHDIVKKFGKGSKMIDKCLTGILSEEKDHAHDGLQNFSTIKGHRNRAWKDSLRSDWEIIKKAEFYLSELEPIDAATAQ